MFNLKSELYKKEKEIKELQSHVLHNTATTHKTSIVKASSSVNKKVPTWLKKNSGIEKRNQNDLLEVKQEDKHSQVQAILEAKAKLYDNMTKGDFIPDSEDVQVFLVDFEQKSIDAWRERSEKGSETVKPTMNVKMSSEVMKTIDDVKDKWVEYVDDFGRTRTALKSELPQQQKEHQSKPETSEIKTLMSDDMRREDERLKWEKSAIEEMQNELHYENLRFGENRELGVGYFAFSGKQAERDEQLKRLEQYRKETEKRKHENEVKKQKQQTALTARLEKVRQRRIKQLQSQGKDIPASLLEPVKIEQQKQNISDEATLEQKEIVVETLEPVSTKTREWDKGKVEWQPAKPPIAPKSWLDPREERPSEFAPPDFYYASSNQAKADSPPPKQAKHEEIPEEQNTDNERIERLLSEMRSKDKSGDENPPPPSETETVPTPYAPKDKPISIKIMSKPTKLFNTKPAFDV